MHEGSGNKDGPFCLLDFHAGVDAGPVESKGLIGVNEAGGWDQEAMRGSKGSEALMPKTSVMVFFRDELGEVFHERFLIGSGQDDGAVGESPVAAMGVAAGGFAFRTGRGTWQGDCVRIRVLVFRVIRAWTAPEWRRRVVDLGGGGTCVLGDKCWGESVAAVSKAALGESTEEAE